MAGPIYAATNLIDGATIAATSGTATGSALASLYVLRPSKTWTSGAVTANQRLNIDLGSSQTADLMAVHNHNFPLASTIKLERSATGAWAGEEVHVGTFTMRAPDMYLSFVAVASQYWSLRMQDSDGAAGAFPSAPKIGEFVLADSVQLSRAFRWGYRLQENANQIRHKTKNGQLWTARRTPKTRDFGLSWQTMNQAQLDELRAFHDATADAAVPCTVIPYPDVAALAAEVYYVDVEPALGITDIHTANKHAALQLHELPREVVLT